MPTVLLCATLLTVYRVCHPTHLYLYVCVLSITVTGGGGAGKGAARAGLTQIEPLVMFGNNW